MAHAIPVILALLLAAVAGPGIASEPTAIAGAQGALGRDGANFVGGVMRLPLHGGAKACRPLSSRVVFPTGYSAPPHTHSVDPNAVVIRGVSNIAFSKRVDRTQAWDVDAGGYLHSGRHGA
ncbi:DUF4437 domain-containing protein [Luteimonas vadosa]|uniref:Cupin type-1 domain-containing protein n=1 Tax=Luteimonas vadosa TaxID=1165507 RepID=A0ABP9DZ98_9GAMM